MYLIKHGWEVKYYGCDPFGPWGIFCVTGSVLLDCDKSFKEINMQVPLI